MRTSDEGIYRYMNWIIKIVLLAMMMICFNFGYNEYKKRSYCIALSESQDFPRKSVLPRYIYEVSGKLELPEELKNQLDIERELVYKKCLVVH
ncbi:hypothetical protein MACH09_35050 [Vibrio sp. MACH09]|nr:hypothetical protein MACH09_35050 [Vibrio sp. MACH09]